MLESRDFFSTDSFMPHGHCYLWLPDILWLNVVSDLLIALAYLSIPITLLYFLKRRRDLPFNWIFLLFSAFILACGTTHVMDVVTVWIPLYAMAGLLKAFTALVSIVTAIGLVRLIPAALALPSPSQLRALNVQLTQEIHERRIIEEDLKRKNQEMALLNAQVVEAAAQTARAEALEKGAKRFVQVVEAAPNGMILVNPEGEIELTNSQVERMFGYTHEELVGQQIEMLIPSRFRSQHPALRKTWFDQTTSRVMGQGRDLHARRKEGTEFPVEITINRVDTETGVMVLASVVDITVRVQAMNDHEANTRELERQNRELNSFAYVASHDLKSPLRGIDQLATWLTEDLKGHIDATSIEHLRLMRVRINRLENLLDDLLAYSRAGRIEGHPEMLDSAALVRDVFELCRDNSPFSLTLEGHFPTFVTTRTPLELVFRNLMNNAIKHHDHAGGEITVRVQHVDDKLQFAVADNGPGIAAIHFERIFRMFQTLRPRDAVEGSGMGLAIVKKTVEAFGGTIQVEANKPRGVVFTFSWPDRTN